MQLDAFLAFLPELKDEIEQAITKQLQESSPELVSDVQKRIDHRALIALTQADHAGEAVDANALIEQLRQSYSAQVEGTTLTIGSSSPEAKILEIGTASTPPRPVLYPAVSDHMTEITEAIGQAVVDTIMQKST